MNNNSFKNHWSQIETLSVIVHTPITSLFKGAQLMNYAVGILILLCCAVSKVSSTAMFLCIVYITLQNWNKFGCFSKAFFTQMEEKKIRIACFSFRLLSMLKKVSSFYVCSICLRNLLFKLKRMKKNVKQNVRRQDSVENVSWNQGLFFYLQE